MEASPDGLLVRGPAFARFSEWPDEEQDAVRVALRAMLARAVTGARPTFFVEESICAVAHVDHDLTPLLSYLDTVTGDAADAGIARLARYWADDLAAGGEPSPWWFPRTRRHRSATGSTRTPCTGACPGSVTGGR